MISENLIITTAINYDYDIHHRFIGSLFDNINNVKLVVFISKNDETHILNLKKIYNNIEYILIDMNNIHIVNLRFKLYYDYLLENYNKYNLIFLCDYRDVLFQKNIFLHPIINSNIDLYVFKEESLNISVDKCQFNSLYVKKCNFDIELFKNKSIICAGTILGNNKGILEYLKIFNYILNNEIPIEKKNQYGVDAGINYKILYTDLLKHINIMFCNNYNKLVYTMAFPIHLNIINYNILLNENNKIMYDNEIVYCVHQYDRLNEYIKKKISNKYNFITI